MRRNLFVVALHDERLDIDRESALIARFLVLPLRTASTTRLMEMP